MTQKAKGHDPRAVPVPLSKQEIDRRIESVLADLSAAIEVAASGGGSASSDPLEPRLLPSGVLTGRMRRLMADN